MSTTESVSVSSLEEIVDLPGHLRFLSGLLDRHELPAECEARWAAELAAIRRRQEDQALRVGLLGEPASGKSTLLNALIRWPLLAAHALPAPAAAEILVRHGPQPRLWIDNVDGRGEQLGDDESFAELVKRLTSFEEAARTVSRVTLEIPAPLLEKGFAAIEIPSLSQTAVRDLCDAALVTIPADIPVSETLVELLRTRLGESLHRCLFVVTKIDRVRPRERPRLLETIAGRIAGKLGVDSPLVVPVSAAAALGEPLPDGTDGSSSDAAGEDYRELQTQLAAAEERIVQWLEAQRAVLLLERGAMQVAAAFDRFEADLQEVEARARSAREAAEEGSLRGLRPRIEESRKRHVAALALRLDQAVDHARNAIAATRQESLIRIHDLIARARGGEGLRGAVAQAGEVLSVLEEHLVPHLVAVCAQIDTATRGEAAGVAADLPALHPLSATTEGGLPRAGKAARDLQQLVHGGITGSTPAVLAHIRADQRKLIVWLVAGTFVGLLLNLMIPLPFVFLSVPCLVLLLSPRGERRRKMYWELLRSTVESSFARLDAAVGMRLAEMLGEARQQLEETADRYFALYDDLAQSRAAADRARAEEAARAERRARGDLDDLARRRQDLGRARSGLQQIHSL